MYLELDGQDELYRQLFRALKHAIVQGRIAPRARLPATRALAAQLGLSRKTVLAAYALLCAQHLAVSRGGSGTWAAAQGARGAGMAASAAPVAAPSRYAARLRALPPLPVRPRLDSVRIDLQYGEPMADPRLFTLWARSLSHAAARNDGRYPEGPGLASLREQIASYLGQRRGVQCTAQDIVVTNGTQHAVSLVARVLLDEGECVAVEDPGYALTAQCLEAHGAALAHVPVDADGLQTDALAALAPRVVVVTPSHQFPSGARLSAQRRAALLDCAAASGMWVLEDDYDGEFGFEGRMLPALRSLDRHGRVIYVGSFSKTIFPALRLGFVVCPAGLRDDIRRARLMSDVASNGMEQAALAHFMASGAFARHLDRTAVELRRRRRALAQGIARYCGDRVALQDAGAGMHCVAWLPGLQHHQMETLVVLAAQRGLGLQSVAGHYRHPPPTPGLLLGFAGIAEAQIRLATRLLGECLRALGQQAH